MASWNYAEYKLPVISNADIACNFMQLYPILPWFFKCKHITHAMQPNLCTESLGLSYQRFASQPNGDHDESQIEPYSVQRVTL